MAILAALIAFGSRFATKILTTALGWASTLLFGRVPASRQILLLGITFGSVIWLVMLAGVIVPDVGAFLLLLVPPQEVVPEGVIRVVMLIGVLLVPGIVGVVTLALDQTAARDGRRILEAIARGYPLTILLAVLLVFLALLAIWRKARSLMRRWTDAHVPMVVKPGAYEDVARDLEIALDDAGFDLTARAAPAAMSKPATWLARVAGSSSASLVPERMLELRGERLNVLVYPMDVLISGTSESVNRARAAIASRLTTSAAHLTVSAEAQALEDRISSLTKDRDGHPDTAPRFDDEAAAAFAAIDESLATIPIPYEEWEVLYRQRLQVERDLRAGAMSGEAIIGGVSPGADEPAGRLTTFRNVIQVSAEVLIDAATDKSTAEALDRLVGTRWRLAARAADVAVDVARAAVRGSAKPEHTAPEDAGEPARFSKPGDASPD